MDELHTPEYGKHECVPTQDAYDRTVRALEKHRERANRAEATLADLRDRMTALADLWESHDDRPAVHPAAIAVRAVLAGEMDPREPLWRERKR